MAIPKPSRYYRTEEITDRAQELRSDVSKTEAKLWARLCKDRMGVPFRRQHPIGSYFADYCCVPLRLVIEVDGPLHDAGEDEVRDLAMRKLGYDVLRFSVEDMDVRFKNVVEAIQAEVQLRLRARGAK